MKIKLKLLELDLAIVKLENVPSLIELLEKAKFFSFTKSDDEVSLVVETKFLEDQWNANAGWRAFVIAGPLDFSLVGILKQVLTPLAGANIGVFTISTFDTDYILIKEHQVKVALNVLKTKFEVSEN